MSCVFLLLIIPSHPLFSIDAQIEAVKPPASYTFLSPVLESAAYYLGLASATSARVIQGDIEEVRLMLTVRRLSRILLFHDLTWSYNS